MITIRIHALCTFPFLLTLLDAADARPTRRPTIEDLAPAIEEHINQDRLQSAFWGIHIESLDSGRVLYSHNGHKLLRPASNAKLFTAALALDRLGPNHRLRTSCYALQPPSRNGTLKGDLWIYGRGDFSMAARFHNGDASRALLPLAQAIEDAGVRRIRGALIGDDTFFTGPPFGAGWTWDDLQHYYGAETSALVLEDNVVDLLFTPGPSPGTPCRLETRPMTGYLSFIHRTLTVDRGGANAIALYRPPGANVVHVEGQLALDSTNWVDAVSVNNAPLWFASQLHDLLRQRGLRIQHPPRAVNWLTPAHSRPDYHRLVEIAAVESPPMSELLTQMMKTSQNLYAHALFLQVGRLRELRQPPTPSPRNLTERAAVAELTEFLLQYGISPDSVRLEEGSGLSRRSLVTPHAVVALLKVMHQHPQANVFRCSLPVAGVDGTLRDRMRNSAAENRVVAKTGTLAHVYALSGYVTTKAGERLVFAFLLNNHDPASTSEARADLDTLAILLAALEDRS